MTNLEIIYSVIGVLFTLCIGALGFLTARLISQYDDFQKETGRNIKSLRQEVISQRTTLGLIQRDTESIAGREEVDKETKAKISQMLLSIAKVEKELNKIKPFVEMTEEDHGKVLMIEDKLKSQEKQLRTLYETVKAMIQKQKGH